MAEYTIVKEIKNRSGHKMHTRYRVRRTYDNGHFYDWSMSPTRLRELADMIHDALEEDTADGYRGVCCRERESVS